MTERAIDPVSEAIGSLKSDVRTMLDNQKSRDDIDAGFRREMREALSGFAQLPLMVTHLTERMLKCEGSADTRDKKIEALERRLDRVRNITTGALIVLSGIWVITLLVINKAPDWVRLFQG